MKQKILFIIPTLVGGGAERSLLNLLNVIDVKKYDIELCIVSNRGNLWDEVPSDIKVTVIFKRPIFGQIFKKLHTKIHFSFIYRLFVRHKIKTVYDIGICFSDGPCTDLLFFLNDRIKRKISWVHSCYISYDIVRNRYQGHYRERIINQRCKRLDDIVFVSENARKEYVELLGKYPNMYVIYNIINKEIVIKKSSEALSERFKKDEINIIALGNLLPVKGYDKLIKAARILADKNYKFKIRILGAGPLKDKLTQLINEYNVSDYVILSGFHTNPYPYLKSSDIYVMPSLSEAMPLALIEAMILKLPVVTTSCSGCMEITDNGKTAIIAEHSEESIANCLEKLIIDENMRNIYSQLSYDRSLFFEPQKILDKVENLLENRLN